MFTLRKMASTLMLFKQWHLLLKQTDLEELHSSLVLQVVLYMF